MQPRIRTMPAPRALAGVLVKYRDLNDAQRAHDMLCNARRSARATLAAAQREADAIRRYAAARGYREGLREAWRSITPWLDAFEQSCTRARDTLCDDLLRALEASFEHAHVVEFVMDRVLTDLANSNALPIRISVPAAMKGLISDLKTWAERAHASDAPPTPRVTVSLSDDDRLTIECGEAVYLFDVPALVTQMSIELQTRSPESSTGLSDDAQGTTMPTRSLAAGRDALASIDTGIIARHEANPIANPEAYVGANAGVRTSRP